MSKWITAAGSCGFAGAKGAVEALYLSGFGLFAFQVGMPGVATYSCIIVGHCAVMRASAAEAKGAALDLIANTLRPQASGFTEAQFRRMLSAP
ncbi:MAG: hypothetical protein PHR35_21845 [Kiritimatiellae bacterium]|nr:hypothetical protein [Kiritimatiellia bacterium]